ncbi:NAD-P-binding protein [Amylostereum chailletii]|nr:NAD-P-binding protein [Amylostereum chailletii]
MKLIGDNERLPVTLHHDVYPAIDPEPHFAAQTFRTKVVLVTGASYGIGQDIARFYARAGAHLVLVARTAAALDQTKDLILQDKSKGEVLIFVADVRDSGRAEEVVKATVEKLGRLDILVTNAGVLTPWNQPLAEKDSDAWWNTFEVNVRGVFNYVRPAIPFLEECKGHLIAISAEASHIRIPGASDYHISKQAINRLVEYVVLEHPEVKAFALHPGVISTHLAVATQWEGLIAPDTAALPAATALYLSAGKADWLSGRYYSANWDLEEAERVWKGRILAEHGLVSKLCIPR